MSIVRPMMMAYGTKNRMMVIPATTVAVKPNKPTAKVPTRGPEMQKKRGVNTAAVKLVLQIQNAVG